MVVCSTVSPKMCTKMQACPNMVVCGAVSHTSGVRWPPKNMAMHIQERKTRIQHTPTEQKMYISSDRPGR